MRLLIVHNPSAGGGSHGDEIEQVARRHGHVPTLVGTDDGWMDQVRERSADLLVVAGGDGTVREIVTSLAFDGSEHPSVALLPLGTANNIARSLGLDVDDPWAEVAAWDGATRRVVDVDVALVEGVDPPRPFVESFGGGFVAAALASAEDAPEQTDDGNEHGRQHLMEVLDRAEPSWWSLVVDGQDRSGTYLAVEVMNVPTVGPILPLAPSASPHDGWLDVVCISESCLELLRSTIDGTADGTGLEVLGGTRATTLEVTAPEGVPMHLDDELFDGDGDGRRITLGGRTVPVLRAADPDPRSSA
ncbi:MAG: hypothetical protein M3Y51_02450 [Actinomycetota bacterium]|nr:hypothetical protein [Actinomycetota bacterium]